MGLASYDDAYITYRFAHNLSSGHGFAYNVDEPHLATTTPLLTLTLATMGRLSSPDLIPRFGQWLTGLALILLALLLYQGGAGYGRLFAPLLLITNPALSYVWGGETLWLLLFVVGAFHSYQRERFIASAVLGGLAFLTRGEGILVPALLALWYVLQYRKLPWKAGLALLATVLPWSLYAYLLFGSPLPSTLEAKQAQMASGYWGPFLRTSIDWLRAFVTGSPTFSFLPTNYLHLITVALMGVGALSIHRWAKGAAGQAATLVWIFMYVLGYTVLGIPFYTWYALPLILAGVILAGHGLTFLDVCWEHRPAIRMMLHLLAVLPVLAGLYATWTFLQNPIPPVQRLYTETGHWLHAHTDEDAVVGFFEIGFMGYHAQRSFVDPMGLASPEAIPWVAKGDFTSLYETRRPEYILLTPIRWNDRIGLIRNERWFTEGYERIHEIGIEDYFDSPLGVYRRIHK